MFGMKFKFITAVINERDKNPMLLRRFSHIDRNMNKKETQTPADKPDYKEYLKKIYFNPKNPAAYTGVEQLYQIVKAEGKYKIGRYRIREWLQNQKGYSLQKTVPNKFRRRRVISYFPNYMFDADLLSVESISSYNSGIRYFLMCIDIFTRKLYLKTLVNKQSATVLEAFKKIIKTAKPDVLRTDAGSEFTNNLLKKYLNSLKITHIITRNTTKANYAEIVNRWFKRILYKYFTQKNTYRYLDVLDDLVESYNNKPHRSLDYHTPNSITKDNWFKFWYTQYVPPLKHKLRYQLKIGDHVRISLLKNKFTRAYDQQWSTEIFIISGRYKSQGIPIYKLKQYDGEPLIGSFYESELVRLNPDANALWEIEKIIKYRGSGKNKEALVTFKGWPSKYQSYIKVSELKDI